MSISRRQFVLGTAAGLILPSYYDKVLTYFENHDAPLIEIPKRTSLDLYALDLGSGDYEFNLGSPSSEPPAMTVREFAIHYYGNEDKYREAWCWEEDAEVDFDAYMDPDVVFEFWARSNSSNAKAYRLLEGLDLEPDLHGDDAVGEILFIDGPAPGNDYLGAQATDEVTISLLQKRLNDLDTGIRISMA
ncbi:MAG: hypothetical protein ACI88G_001664 [Woeseiaceae bacterium]|jgi:hypothetical protein